MTANVAGIRLSIEGGADLADKVDPRLIELTLTEKTGGEADQLDVTLHNHDGALVTPEPGKILVLAIGWKSGDEVSVGMVEKGRFKVDEVELSGPPDIVTIRARSADFVGEYRNRRTHAWKDTTLGAILAEIAGRNGLTARVHPDLSSKAIAAIEQHNKSDMVFVRDLGSRYDAVATWKDRKLVFMPIGSATTAGGKAIPAIAVTRKQGWTWRFTRADRDGADGAQAYWHDQNSGRRRAVKIGSGKRRKLKRVYANEAEARQAAEAEASKRKRDAWTFEYDLTFADLAIQPNGKVTLSGWNTRIDGISWLVESIETTLDGKGLAQRLTLKGR